MSLQFFMIPGWASSPIVFDFLRPICEKFGKIKTFSWLDAIGKEPFLHQKIQDCSDEIILIGWSLGAAATLRAASEFPDKIKGIILFAATPKLPHTEDLPGADPRVCRAMQIRLRKDPENLLNEFATNSCFPMFNERFNQAFVKNALLQDALLLDKGLAYLNQSDWREGVSKISAHTLIFHGSQDKIVPIAAAHWLAKRIPNSELVEITDAGHMMLFTHQAEISTKCGMFLQQYFSHKE